MSRRLVPAHLLRFVVVLALGASIGLGAASAVPAASFDDSYPCPEFVCPSGVVDSPYSLQLTGVAGCEIYWWELQNGALPSGLTLSRSGLISGTPTSAGIAKFWIQIHDVLPEDGGHAWCGGDNTSEREFTLRIDPGLVITTEVTPPAATGAAYSLTLAAGVKSAPGAVAPAPSAPSWSIVEGQLPTGLALEATTGVISGTPSADGEYAFVARASFADGRSATKALSIVVKTLLAVVPPDEIPASEVGVAVQIALGATGGTPAYTWTLASGALPEGVVLTAAGLITGRPLTAGLFRFTAAVADTGGQTASYSGVLRVAARLTVARPAALRRGIVGRPYRVRIVARGGVAPTTWTLAGRLPRGVRFDRTTSTLSGVPRAPGRYRMVVRATDQLGVTSKRSYLLIVVKPKKR